MKVLSRKDGKLLVENEGEFQIVFEKPIICGKPIYTFDNIKEGMKKLNDLHNNKEYKNYIKRKHNKK